MATPEEQRMDALSGAIARMLHRQEEIDRRLARIEDFLSLEATPKPEAVPVSPPPPIAVETPPVLVPVEEISAAPPPIPPPLPDAVAAAEATDQPRRLETSIGLTLINRIGVITLVIGVGFFFKWAVDNNYIGEAGRVALGVLAGFLAIGAADFLYHRRRRVFAQGITAIGIAILYLSFFAAFGYYHLIPQALAFVLMAITTAMAGALSIRYKAIAIAGLGLAGGYLTPFMLSTGTDAPWFLFTYIVFLNLGAMGLAKSRDWKALEILSAIATILLYGAWLADKFNSEKQTVATVFALVFYALFSITRFQPIYLLSQLLVTGAFAIIWEHEPGPYFVLSLLVAAGGLVVADQRRWNMAVGFAFAPFWLITIAWMESRPMQEMVAPLFLGLTCAFVLFLSWLPWWLLIRKERARSSDLALLALNGAAYFGASYHLLNPQFHAWMGLFAVGLAAIHLVLGMYVWRRGTWEERDLPAILLAIGVALTFLTLAAPIQFTAYRITMAWALEAAALTWIAMKVRRIQMLIAAACIYVLVFARLTSIDAWIYSNATSYTMLLNQRFSTFLLVAISTWLSAWWAKENKPLALIYYIGGHFVFLWTLTQEVLDWAVRTTPEQNVLSVQTVSVSILYAIYALILVAIGVGTRTVVNRIGGLTLLGFVVLKLYVFDVWQVSRIYRISAFVALGVLLLSTSFLYSHFRSVIESWWKDETADS